MVLRRLNLPPQNPNPASEISQIEPCIMLFVWPRRAMGRLCVSLSDHFQWRVQSLLLHLKVCEYNKELVWRVATAKDLQGLWHGYLGHSILTIDCQSSCRALEICLFQVPFTSQTLPLVVVFVRPFVKRFALCYRTVFSHVCPVCLDALC